MWSLRPLPARPGSSSKPGGSHRRTPSIVSENPNRPYLGLSTFRMCVLADPLLEDFFASDLTQSWKLEVLIAEEKPKVAGAVGGAVGWFGGLVSSVMTEENKVRACSCSSRAPASSDGNYHRRNASTGSQTKSGGASRSRRSSTGPASASSTLPRPRLSHKLATRSSRHQPPRPRCRPGHHPFHPHPHFHTRCRPLRCACPRTPPRLRSSQSRPSRTRGRTSRRRGTTWTSSARR